MDWVGIVALAVGFVIWLISNLAKANEAPGRRPGAPAGGGAANEPPRPRPSTTEIDRFLEEINRRRQQQQQRRPGSLESTETAAPPPPPARPRVEDRPVPVPRSRPAPAPKQPQRPTVRTAYTAPPPVQALPTVVPVSPAESAALLRPVRPLPGAPTSPQLKMARDLLASGQGLRTAIILNEIFGPPRSKRPR